MPNCINDFSDFYHNSFERNYKCNFFHVTLFINEFEWSLLLILFTCDHGYNWAYVLLLRTQLRVHSWPTRTRRLRNSSMAISSGTVRRHVNFKFKLTSTEQQRDARWDVIRFKKNTLIKLIARQNGFQKYLFSFPFTGILDDSTTDLRKSSSEW